MGEERKEEEEGRGYNIMECNKHVTNTGQVVCGQWCSVPIQQTEESHS